MDWEVTHAYCEAFAKAFNVPIYFSWKEGGFKREMLRKDAKTAPIWFQTPASEYVNDVMHRTSDYKGHYARVGGDRGKLSTRMKFPQVSPDLSVRWCSSYLKIDVGSAALRNQTRFNGIKTLFITGERGEESSARSKYNVFEPDRSDGRNGRKKRHIDHWRPIRDWTEYDVWEIIERYKVRVHPAYYLGWGRVSCKFCIFGNANQFASAASISPAQANELIMLENEFGCTIKRNTDLSTLILKGTSYEGIKDSKMVKLATSKIYNESIFMENWVLPLGAYGESCGPQ